MNGQQGRSPSYLLGQLSDELSRLVRYDVELATAERIPALRQGALDGVVLLGGMVAAGFALAGLSWATVEGLDLVIPAWASPVVVAGAWALVAAGLLLSGKPRRLLAQVSIERSNAAIESTQAARAEAEKEIRATAEHLAEALLRETTRQGVEAAERLAERGVETVEADARRLLSELADVLGASGKAGLSILDRRSADPGN